MYSKILVRKLLVKNFKKPQKQQQQKLLQQQQPKLVNMLERKQVIRISTLTKSKTPKKVTFDEPLTQAMKT